MFYSHFVLQKKGPLARIWLAAHWDKKITKAQVFETNIETSVDGILKPKVKIALRTSGHLLLGVVRIYSRKAKYLLADCNEAFVKIKMAFRPGMVDLPEEHREAAVNTITLPEVFHDFDAIPELNDADIEAQFSLNQSRAEEITMREDYGNLCLVTNDEGFGDMGFDNEPADLLQNASTLDQSHLELFHEPNHISLKEPQPSTSRAAARSLEIDTPIRGDGFGGNFGQDIVAGGLFEGGLSLFDDTPIGEMPVSEPSALGQPKPGQAADDSDDDGDHDFGAPPSVGGHSSDGSRPPSPIPDQQSAEAKNDQPAPVMDSPLHRDGGAVNGDQTTLVQNEEESFALAPVDASALKGLQKTKRKRKLIVDEVKNISGEEMKAQLSDTSDIVTTLDLAPPTKKLMHWKESGGVEKLFALPDNQIPARTLFKNYQRHLTLRMVDNELHEHVDKHDEITLEQIRDADGDGDMAPVPAPRGRPGRKRKQPVEADDSLQRGAVVQPDTSLTLPDYLPAPTPQHSHHLSGASSGVDSFQIPPPGTPQHQQDIFGHVQQTPVHHLQDIPADQLNLVLGSGGTGSEPAMENMGYDHNNPLMANMGYDEQHPPAVTPGAISDRGQNTPWNDDYEFPNSAGPPEEQQTDETYEQYEERVLNKRAAHMYHILKSKLGREGNLFFSEMVHKNNKKQVAQKFYTLLVLKKTQVLELEQEAAYEELIIARGPNFECPML